MSIASKRPEPPDPPVVMADPPARPSDGSATSGEGTSGVPMRAVEEASLLDGSALAALFAAFSAHHGDGADADKGAIERAFTLAASAHREQRRRSGEPYLVHPVRVAQTIADLGLDAVSICAGLLHDAVEDSELTVFEVHEQFGREVASIVDGVTKLGKIPYLSKQQQQAESFRKMLLAMSEDIRVLVVKLIDRLDNMRTLDHMPRDKQERTSQETTQIYAPLAGRLGIEWIRRELQDLGFRYLEPAVHASLQSGIDRFLEANPGVVEHTAEALASAFGGDASVVAEDDTEVKRAWPVDTFGPVRVRATMRPPYRAHSRLEASGRGPEQLADVATFQVIARDRMACYAALGQLHACFQPVPGRFRDYVALPRPNHYRALHTSVIDRAGRRLEVHIRSERMDAVAERGIIAQWNGMAGGQAGAEARRMRWLGELMDWQEEVSDPSEFIEAVKADLFADEVYVFTPGGDIHAFPKGATPIDFAFAIHTDVGMQCSGARVNGHIVPLRYRLRQGDAVEILTNPTVGPREEWLKMCVSSRARAKIKQVLRNRERERLRSLGRSLVEQEVSSRGLELTALEESGELAGHAEDLGLGREARDLDGIYEAVGGGALSPTMVADRVDTKASERSLIGRVLRRVRGSRGFDGLGNHAASPIVLAAEHITGKAGAPPVVALAPCCSPVPGDRLVGFFEPGRGILAHVEGCPDALEAVEGRRVHLTWQAGLDLECPVTLEVRTANSVGLLAQMSRAFSTHGVNIKQANCRAYGDGARAINTFHVEVHDLAQLEALTATLKAIDGVVGVQRVFSPRGGTIARP